MNALELKVPPLVLVLLHTWAMWFAASQLPSFAFPLPLPHGFAATVCGVGILFLLAETYLFQKQDHQQTVKPYLTGGQS